MRVEEARVYVLSPQLQLVAGPRFFAFQKNLREPLTLTPGERRNLVAALAAEMDRDDA